MSFLIEKFNNNQSPHFHLFRIYIYKGRILMKNKRNKSKLRVIKLSLNLKEEFVKEQKNLKRNAQTSSN